MGSTNVHGCELADQVVSVIRSVVGVERAALHEPVFSGNEWRYVKECLDSTYVSSVGKFVDRFEHDLAAYTGAKYAVAVMNGTAALHMALCLAGVQRGDEVLVPALTFVATANAVAYCGAIPHFCDSEDRTLGIDSTKLRHYLGSISEQRAGNCINKQSGRIIRCIVPMHTFGHPVEIDALMELARDFNLSLVEDAAESLGSFYSGKHTGTFGLLGTLSFNGNKTITTGGGGAILTDDVELARRAKHLTTTAKLAHQWEYRHDEIGYNYRMPNINAALGCAQLEALPYLLECKRNLFHRYHEAFSTIPGLSLMVEPARCRSNYWLQTLVFDAEYVEFRDSILQSTNDAGYMTRPAWILINELIPYLDCPCMDLSVTTSLSQRMINIPSSSNLTRNEKS